MKPSSSSGSDVREGSGRWVLPADVFHGVRRIGVCAAKLKPCVGDDGSLGIICDMALNETQTRQVAEWIQGGMDVPELQKRLASEFGEHLTYMAVRFLVDDLNLTIARPPEPEPAPAPVEAVQPEVGVDGGVDGGGAAGDAGAVGAQESVSEEGGDVPAGAPNVKVKVATLARPGAMVSGTATFSDGQTAEWYLDQFGRLGMVPPYPGFRPSNEDVQMFQMLLDSELAKAGY
ncbi:MAG: hypothetical protein RIS92_415 [Verrucomicrobiota bacterium]